MLFVLMGSQKCVVLWVLCTLCMEFVSPCSYWASVNWGRRGQKHLTWMWGTRSGRMYVLYIFISICCHSPGDYPTSTSRDVSDQAFSDLQWFRLCNNSCAYSLSCVYVTL